MKKLILIRHAKSSWEFDVIDHERPLKTRGINDANLVATELKSHNIIPDKVLISDAMRTKLTAQIILPVLNIPESKVSFDYKLYDFSGKDLVDVIKSCGNSVETLMVFGHNHAITAFVNTYGDKFIDNVPTCGVVIIEFEESEWSKISTGKTTYTLFPRNLK
ncbi:SixA phosphatase family protein [Hyunsoonleella pacifica]|uniref:Histidine phosphatase family protein n=1 Tax=Hyunsoonleella pacifica TaxID=1080224 RepID=A0A4Q9FJR3_9FLAO|nr:histidine phosphatase family protein [Hyunsoonleella pacifica]TBN13198.1 histidine phosphatase family protein [Hyunsoonleella pacifica]